MIGYHWQDPDEEARKRQKYIREKNQAMKKRRLEKNQPKTWFKAPGHLNKKFSAIICSHSVTHTKNSQVLISWEKYFQ